MTKQRLGAIMLILLLIISNVFFVFKYIQSQKESEQLKADIAAASSNLPIIEFNQLFVDKILRAEGEISYDTRFELETKARSLKDTDILDQWNSFVATTTEAEAQAEVKELLGLLAQRMKG